MLGDGRGEGGTKVSGFMGSSFRTCASLADASPGSSVLGVASVVTGWIDDCSDVEAGTVLSGGQSGHDTASEDMVGSVRGEPR